MADYKSMYYKLFNQVSKTIEELENIQHQTEELFALTETPNLYVLKVEKNENINSEN